MWGSHAPAETLLWGTEKRDRTGARGHRGNTKEPWASQRAKLIAPSKDSKASDGNTQELPTAFTCRF